jgi:hypothetical protein
MKWFAFMPLIIAALAYLESYLLYWPNSAAAFRVGRSPDEGVPVSDKEFEFLTYIPTAEA